MQTQIVELKEHRVTLRMKSDLTTDTLCIIKHITDMTEQGMDLTEET
jgi:hypothetical protein